MKPYPVEWAREADEILRNDDGSKGEVHSARIEKYMQTLLDVHMALPAT
jgi:hypothetical protein